MASTNGDERALRLPHRLLLPPRLLPLLQENSEQISFSLSPVQCLLLFTSKKLNALCLFSERNFSSADKHVELDKLWGCGGGWGRIVRPRRWERRVPSHSERWWYSERRFASQRSAIEANSSFWYTGHGSTVCGCCIAYTRGASFYCFCPAERLQGCSLWLERERERAALCVNGVMKNNLHRSEFKYFLISWTLLLIMIESSKNKQIRSQEKLKRSKIDEWKNEKKLK